MEVATSYIFHRVINKDGESCRVITIPLPGCNSSISEHVGQVTPLSLSLYFRSNRVGGWVVGWCNDTMSDTKERTRSSGESSTGCLVFHGLRAQGLLLLLSSGPPAWPLSRA